MNLHFHLVPSSQIAHPHTTLLLTEDVSLNVYRNVGKYGVVRFRLLNSKNYLPISGCTLTIEGIEEVTDGDGYVKIKIPLDC